eukprot:scaffold29748_cov87-Skeletonema_marinoi.AAC.2
MASAMPVDRLFREKMGELPVLSTLETTGYATSIHTSYLQSPVYLCPSFGEVRAAVFLSLLLFLS